VNREARTRTRAGRSIGLALLSLAAGAALPGCPGSSASCDIAEADWTAYKASGHSSARFWDEVALHAVRKDLPRPTVHARNLFHLSAAMFDAWAAYDPTARGVYSQEKHLTGADDTARSTAVAYAAHRVLAHRYANSAGGAPIVTCIDEGLSRLGLANDGSTSGDSPAAVGNRIGQAVLDATLGDGSNEANNYADTTGWQPTNTPLSPGDASTPMADPQHWQQLLLQGSVSQNGISQPALQKYVGAQWGLVKPFAMQRTGRLYHDPGPAPAQASDQMRNTWVVDVMRKQAQLDLTSSALIDTSPGHLGNNTLGSNDGTGHAQNPSTGLPYVAQPVLLGAFGRVIAEYWADGPSSETPPGHWNLIANQLVDWPGGFSRKLGGSGDPLPALEWDVKVYLALNGALHDAAITAWEIKRDSTTARPISLIRYLATTDPRGLPLVPGLIEQRDGRVQALSWRPPSSPGLPSINWSDATGWTPYQQPTFVTPAFPGFISGHSTFSRAGAEVLADLTGSPWFPGGLWEFRGKPGFAITIDQPDVAPTVHLQWATFFDAADQAGQSRLWGGIHIEPDDLVGRKLGHQVGLDAVALARKYYAGVGP
jgi:hypothetical protein